MHFSLEDDFEVVKPQMMFNEGLLVYLQSVDLEEESELLYSSKL